MPDIDRNSQIQIGLPNVATTQPSTSLRDAYNASRQQSNIPVIPYATPNDSLSQKLEEMRDASVSISRGVSSRQRLDRETVPYSGTIIEPKKDKTSHIRPSPTSRRFLVFDNHSEPDKVDFYWRDSDRVLPYVGTAAKNEVMPYIRGYLTLASNRDANLHFTAEDIILYLLKQGIIKNGFIKDPEDETPKTEIPETDSTPATDANQG